jgi:alginate O-acetyltransferase complex protein AlgI
LALVAHREWERSGLGRRLPRGPLAVLGTLLTFWWVCLAWIFFRSQDLGTALEVARSFVLFEDQGPRTFGWAPLWTFGGLALVHAVSRSRQVGRAVALLPDWAFALLYGALVPPVLSFMNGAVQPFIYFQF